MKRLIILVMVFIAFTAKAQQDPMFTQYLLNDVVLNPGMTGNQNDWVVNASFRQQWVGFKGAPSTQMISAHGMWGGDSPIGVGGILFNDVTGPTRKTGLLTNYSFNNIYEGGRFSVGIQAGFFQYALNGSNLVLDEADDNVLNADETAFVPDAGIGIYLEQDNLYFGISVPHMVQSRIKFSGLEDINSTIVRHYFIYIGYKVAMGENWKLDPSLLWKSTQAAPIQMDLNLKAIYKEIVWAGVSYRTGDAINAMAGITISDKINIGYAYDIGLSRLRTYNSGSHEAMLSYKFAK